jgi:hypothetical protein
LELWQKNNKLKKMNIGISKYVNPLKLIALGLIVLFGFGALPACERFFALAYAGFFSTLYCLWNVKVNKEYRILFDLNEEEYRRGLLNFFYNDIGIHKKVQRFTGRTVLDHYIVHWLYCFAGVLTMK